MISTGPHPTFGSTWTDDMNDFVKIHETELVEALNSNQEWFFVISAVVIVDNRPAFVFSKKDELPLDSTKRLNFANDMIQEMRLNAALKNIVLMSDPNAYWSAGWSRVGFNDV